jgi:hypothetical protein
LPPAPTRLPVTLTSLPLPPTPSLSTSRHVIYMLQIAFE